MTRRRRSAARYWFREEGWKKHCPYWQSANGGRKDLEGAFGPGTCMGGCWSEPRCMT